MHWLVRGPVRKTLGRRRLEPTPLDEIRARTAELRAAAELDFEDAQHAAIRAIHGLCEAISHADRRGIPPARTLTALESVRSLHAESVFLDRLQTWPRGYAGDFETIEMICDARLISKGSLARCLEWYALNSPVAQQHRNKVQRQTALIVETLARRAKAEILLVGCGGCRDLRAVGPSLTDFSATFTLNDSDPDAIRFALANLPAHGFDSVSEPGNALRVVPRLTRSHRFDLIIAGGIFDYLPDPAAVLLLRNAWRGLLPNGIFFFTNIAPGNPYRPWMQRVLDWKLIERSVADVRRLIAAAGIPPEVGSFGRDLTGLTHLIELHR